MPETGEARLQAAMFRFAAKDPRRCAQLIQWATRRDKVGFDELVAVLNTESGVSKDDIRQLVLSRRFEWPPCVHAAFMELEAEEDARMALLHENLPSPPPSCRRVPIGPRFSVLSSIQARPMPTAAGHQPNRVCGTDSAGASVR